MGKIRQFITLLYERVMASKVTDAAAAISYYSIVSFVPLLIVLLSFFAMMSMQDIVGVPKQEESMELVWRCINDFVPDIGTFFTQETIVNAIENLAGKQSGKVNTISFCMLLWSATLVLAGFVQNLSIAWTKAKPRHFIMERLVGVVVVGIVALLIMALHLILTAEDIFPGFGKFNEMISNAKVWVDDSPNLLLLWPKLPEKIKWVIDFNMSLQGKATELHTTLLMNASYLIMFFAFVFLYKIVPNVPVKWREAAFGSLFSVPALILLKSGFLQYFSMFGQKSYSALYGSLGAVVALMLWIYIASIIILVGGHICAVFAYMTRGESEEGDCGQENKRVIDLKKL